jgi:hypothetical protein
MIQRQPDDLTEHRLVGDDKNKRRSVRSSNIGIHPGPTLTQHPTDAGVSYFRALSMPFCLLAGDPKMTRVSSRSP